MIKKIRKSDFDANTADFEQVNKKYYQEKEDYDWTEVTDNIKGLESFFHRLREKNLVKLIKKYGQGQGGAFLDAGCGTGLILRHLPENSIGLDINPRNIEKARQYLPHRQIILGDVEKIPFENDKFTTVIVSEVLEHLPKPEHALKEILRVLKPGGVLVGTVPRKCLFWKLRVLSSTHPGEPYHKEYQKFELEKLLASQKIVLIRATNFYMTWAFVIEKQS